MSDAQKKTVVVDEQIVNNDQTANPSPPAPEPPKPFDLDSLRLPPAFEQSAGVRSVIDTVLVRKPHRQEWFSVHPNPSYRGNFGLIKLKAERDEATLSMTLCDCWRQRRRSYRRGSATRSGATWCRSCPSQVAPGLLATSGRGYRRHALMLRATDRDHRGREAR